MGQIIKVKPFEISALLDYQGFQEPNEHGRAVLTGRIREDKAEEYQSAAVKTTWVDLWVVGESEKEELLFSGVLSRMEIQKGFHECIMVLELVTGTILLEDKEHFRSFQSDNLTYGDLVEACNAGYDHAASIMTVGRNEKIPHLIMQNHVSDWRFLRRLCRMKGSVLVPSYIGHGAKYFFGMPSLGKRAVFDTDQYSIMNEDIFSYVVKSREVYQIGTRAQFQGQDLTVWKVESRLEGNEVYHTYYLSREMKKLGKETDRNDRDLIGVCVFGTVTGVEKEQAKIRIQGDENQKNSGERWFPFSTVYSSPDGAGWYCMPEKGDSVRLCFPTDSEADAYLCSAVQEKEGGGIRVNPENKIWRNKYGKEIRLTPKGIRITNNQGNMVELSDEEGIRIKSSGSIFIKSDNRIQISSEASGIELSASGRIRLQQGESERLMQDGIKVTGAKVNIM